MPAPGTLQVPGRKPTNSPPNKVERATERRLRVESNNALAPPHLLLVGPIHAALPDPPSPGRHAPGTLPSGPDVTPLHNLSDAHPATLLVVALNVSCVSELPGVARLVQPHEA